MTKLGNRLQKLGLALLLMAVLVWGYSLIRKASAGGTEQERAAGAQGTPESQSTDEAAEVALPPYNAPPGSFVSGIPRLALLHTSIPERPRVEITTYTVQPGDNLFFIADKYGLEPETVLWGNYETLRDNPQLLTPGQELNILPENGVYYEWTEGDTLGEIAEFFKVEPETIVEFRGNGLRRDLTSTEPVEIAVGTWVVIPGGKRELKDWGPPAITRQNPAAAAYYGSGYCGMIYEGAIGVGSFIWPTTSKTISGYDYRPPLHSGIDIGGSIGNAIYATDSGVVVYSGWSEYGYGYLVVLDHGTGWQSAYAHLSAINVGCGESVAQGQVIAGLGSTGNSTGPHLHFELRSEIYGKVNPWDFLIY